MSGIYRTVKNKEYFYASNEPFNDERLSWEARGVIGYLLSKPDGWECRNYDLLNKGPAGEHKLKRIMAELRQYGYLRRYRFHKEDGTFEWVTEIYESPQLNPTIGRLSTDGLSTDGLPIDGKPHRIDNTESDKTDIDNTDGEEPPPSDFELIQSAIKEACKVASSDSNKGYLYKATREAIQTGKTPELIIKFGEWFNKTYWPGKWPSIGQVSTDWPRFEESVKENGNGNGRNGNQSNVVLPTTANSDGSYNF